MMSTLHRDLFKIILSALMALFFIPLIAWFFVDYALPPGREIMPAEPFTPLWQFKTTATVSGAALLAGVVMLMTICALGAAAFINRRAQYLSFVTGWRLLTLFCAVEVVVQGALLVWLAFWLTAFFFQVYYIKLIGIAAILAAMGVFYAVTCIFKRVPQTTTVEGELIDESNSPALWAHIRKLAAEAGTAPPDQIVGGIDTNFFVTESPLSINEQTFNGRSLFVSLPLLRLLDRTEADAVLMHELAHFRGGDTASSAALGPKLVQYDFYNAMMQSAGVTFLVFYVLRLYRVIFEFALKRDSRAREFMADKIAAALVSGRGIIHALIKIGAYARYRAEIEQSLFAEREQHDARIGIADRVAAGLVPYAKSGHFLDAMQAIGVPHPFDSHPALAERMRNVDYEVRKPDYSRIVTEQVDATWIPDINNADAIESALWAAYENRFATAHEQQLAYLYRPHTEAERKIVVKYFPRLEFALRSGQRIVVSYEGLLLPKENHFLSWDNISNIKYEDAFGSDILRITHPEKGRFGAKTTKVKLPGIRKKRKQLKAALGQYWQRHQIMLSNSMPP
ncbi:M48 family metallopeptidase [Methylomonas methanica]|uniref:Peptidase M48 Ste24p n=1 Tax=Methylomonas methanica (strain DSM 25384 / MC09) TaxID=857087 RepID=F9ZYB6_METMM|nr:M48 family metalloprotease [Methylomonas methanica]AEG01021.1 peptidase M48 Ste24p [Methylomonas methanica MC09]